MIFLPCPNDPTTEEIPMTPQLLIFLGAIVYLSWALVRYLKSRNNPDDRPFIEVLDDITEPAAQPPKQKSQRKESDGDREWRKRIKAEIEDLTK
ncbi:MAG: hypothetical protein ACI8V2_002483 [Candidatus Latescibacterota bacterium]|jgi:hypothetical protein